jgi:hypothetical protein
VVVITTDTTCAHTLWIFSGRDFTGLFSRPQSVTQDTTTVVTGDADPVEYTNLSGPLVPFIAHLYTTTLFPWHLSISQTLVL